MTETTLRERHDESLAADSSPREDPLPNLPGRSPRSMVALGVALALPLAAGIIGARATRSSVRTWYPTLRKPSFNPPGWVFGPVWTALYLLMGVAMHLVWSASGRSAGRGRAVWLWLAQLGLNLLWSLIFFGRRSVAAAFVEILVLWVAIAATIREFAVRRPIAAALMLPYLGWTTFAAVLNGSLWRLNRRR